MKRKQQSRICQNRAFHSHTQVSSIPLSLPDSLPSSKDSMELTQNMFAMLNAGKDLDQILLEQEEVEDNRRKRRKEAINRKRARQNIDYLLILDFEATCEKNYPFWEHEIIEFPIVALNTRTLEREYEFHRYVKPTEKPLLTKFCTELTGIQQEWVDAAQPLESVLSEVDAWLIEKKLRYFHTKTKTERNKSYKSFIFATDGPWDFVDFLEKELHRLRLPVPEYYQSWLDIRNSFSIHYKVSRRGVNAMLSTLGMKFEGRPHSGIDDTRNIANIARRMIADGFKVISNINLKGDASGTGLGKQIAKNLARASAVEAAEAEAAVAAGAATESSSSSSSAPTFSSPSITSSSPAEAKKRKEKKNES